MSKTDPKSTAMAVQIALTGGNYYDGEIDGDLGPKSDRGWAALKADLKDPPPSNTPGVWPLQSQMNAFYGNPDADGNGVVDPKWERENIVSITPPYRMVLAWDVSKEVRSIRVHRKCADSLLRILNAIKAHYKTQAAIELVGLHLYGGCFNFRLKRGGSTLSNHSWGSAIDLDPAHNAFGVKYDESKGMMPMAVVKIFQAEGWVWGGPWRTGDAMHFQAARL